MEQPSGRTALITGGASGLGLGMAKAFLGAGFRVAVADIMPRHIDAARTDIGPNENCHFIRLDVTDRAAFAQAIDEAEAALGPITVLCNNAGVGLLGASQDTKPEDWDWVMSVNLGGVFNGVQTILPRMLARGSGHIVNTASIGGILPGPGGLAYLTAKAGVIGLSESLCCDVRDSGIGVSVILLGPTASNIHHVSQQHAVAFGSDALDGDAVASIDKPIIAGGADPLEIGKRVVEAIERNQLYIFTHPEFRHAVRQRFDAMMSEFGPDDGGPPASHSHGFPTFNPLFADILARSAQS